MKNLKTYNQFNEGLNDSIENIKLKNLTEIYQIFNRKIEQDLHVITTTYQVPFSEYFSCHVRAKGNLCNQKDKERVFKFFDSIGVKYKQINSRNFHFDIDPDNQDFRNYISSEENVKETLKNYDEIKDAGDLGLFYKESLENDESKYLKVISTEYNYMEILGFIRNNNLDPLYRIQSGSHRDECILESIPFETLDEYIFQKVLIELNINVYFILKEWEKSGDIIIDPRIKEEYKDLEDAGDLGLFYKEKI